MARLVRILIVPMDRVGAAVPEVVLLALFLPLQMAALVVIMVPVVGVAEIL